VRLRGWIKRLERGARGNFGSFLLEDGTRHYFDPEGGECFLHACECIRRGANGEPFPEPPETIKALTRARNRASALEACGGGDTGLFPYEREALLQRGELIPAEWVHHAEDLSE